MSNVDKQPVRALSPSEAQQAHSSAVSRVIEALNDELAQHYDGTTSVSISLNMHKHAGEKVTASVIERFKEAGWNVELIQPQTGWSDKGIGAPSLIFSRK